MHGILDIDEYRCNAFSLVQRINNSNVNSSYSGGGKSEVSISWYLNYIVVIMGILCFQQQLQEREW
jgi:hypothetical protein